MTTTKKQELKALDQIKKIVADLGESSYIGTAFEGCFEIAEENIRNDFFCSMKQRAEAAKKDADNLQQSTNRLSENLQNAHKKISSLEKRLETEQEWQDYEDKNCISQKDYEHLVSQSDTKFLTDEQAKDLLYDWYGFAKERIIIHRSMPIYQINRHGQIREVDGTVDRQPAYNATDWNYIRFECGNLMYEMHNDSLNIVCF